MPSGAWTTRCWASRPCARPSPASWRKPGPGESTMPRSWSLSVASVSSAYPPRSTIPPGRSSMPSRSWRSRTATCGSSSWATRPASLSSPSPPRRRRFPSFRPCSTSRMPRLRNTARSSKAGRTTSRRCSTTCASCRANSTATSPARPPCPPPRTPSTRLWASPRRRVMRR